MRRKSWGQTRNRQSRWKIEESFLTQFVIIDDPNRDDVVVRVVPPNQVVTCGRHYLQSAHQFQRLIKMAFGIVVDDLPDEVAWQAWVTEHTA